MTPETPKPTNSSLHETASPTENDDLLVDPPDYIAPDQQDMMLIDITSQILHSSRCKISIGHGNEYLSPADSIQLPWPAVGIVFSYNRLLMISLPCWRAWPNRGYKVMNIFFSVDTGPPCSYLCQENMEAFIGNTDCNLPEQLSIAVHDESLTMLFHMWSLGTPEHPGKFQDVNVLGMGFLALHHLSLLVHTLPFLFSSSSTWTIRVCLPTTQAKRNLCSK
jgi:hypothetical protein